MIVVFVGLAIFFFLRNKADNGYTQTKNESLLDAHAQLDDETPSGRGGTEVLDSN